MYALEGENGKEFFEKPKQLHPYHQFLHRFLFSFSSFCDCICTLASGDLQSYT